VETSIPPPPSLYTAGTGVEEGSTNEVFPKAFSPGPNQEGVQLQYLIGKVEPAATGILLTWFSDPREPRQGPVERTGGRGLSTMKTCACKQARGLSALISREGDNPSRVRPDQEKGFNIGIQLA